MSRCFAEQRLAASGWTIKKKTLWNRMLEASEERGMQKRQLDTIANALDGFFLAANCAPGNWLDTRKGSIHAFSATDNLNGDSLLAIEPHVQAELELFLGQQG